MTDNLALAKSVGATVVEGGVLFVGYEQLEKYTQAATEQGKRQPLTSDDIQTIIEMLARHQTFNNEPDCPVVAMCRKLKNMLDEIAPPEGKI